MKMVLSGRVCIVSGASRGIGKGIALQLGEAGATVYITGRTLKAMPGVKGSLEETAAEVEKRGGKCIAVQCDHSKDDDIKALFEQVKVEQNGRLDLLVNNAFSGVKALTDQLMKKFYEMPPEIWDDVNNVGLRNYYLCTVYASRMMLEQGSGLIVWISSVAGLKYMMNVPVGIGKAAADRMAADCAEELKDKNIACISLWPGFVRTENLFDFVEKHRDMDNKDIKQMISIVDRGGTESAEYPGKCVVAFLKDKNIMKRTGRVAITGDMADEYKFNDIDGSRPFSLRSIAGIMQFTGHMTLAWLIPRWIKVPKWLLTLSAGKF